MDLLMSLLALALFVLFVADICIVILLFFYVIYFNYHYYFKFLPLLRMEYKNIYSWLDNIAVPNIFGQFKLLWPTREACELPGYDELKSEAEYIELKKGHVLVIRLGLSAVIVFAMLILLIIVLSPPRYG